MANLHALRDELVRNRVDLINTLNKMHAEYPKEAYEAYTLCLLQISTYFKGSDEGEDVQENSPDLE